MSNQHWADPIERPDREKQRQRDDLLLLVATAAAFAFWVGVLIWAVTP